MNKAETPIPIWVASTATRTAFARARAALVEAGKPAQFMAKQKEAVCDLFIYDAIGGGMWSEGVTAKAVQEALTSAKNAKTLNVYINSPGGDVFDGVAIYNTIKRFAGKKNIYIDGVAASAASVIAMAGDHIVAAKNSTMMIHDAWGFAMGNAREMRKVADDLDKITDASVVTSYGRTGQSVDQIKSWMADETWFDAAEMVKYGFADAISEQEDADEEDAPDEEVDNRLKKMGASSLLKAYSHLPRQYDPSQVRLAKMQNRVLQSQHRASPVSSREGQPERAIAVNDKK